VVTTVRSLEKAEDIQRAHPGIPKSALDFAIVKDIAQEGVFDEVVKSDPPFEAVVSHLKRSFALKRQSEHRLSSRFTLRRHTTTTRQTPERTCLTQLYWALWAF
jgi:hypothetical protein